MLLETLRPEGIQSRNIVRFLSLKEPTNDALAWGTVGVARGIGYRNDGSIQRGPKSSDFAVNAEEQAQNLQTAQNTMGGIFGRGNRVSPTALKKLDEVLTHLDDLGISVIGFAPPYAPTIYQFMIEDGNHLYLADTVEAVSALFERHNFPFFDISNAAWVGGNDEEMYDGSHVTELLMIRSYIYMLRELPHILDPYSDLDNLETIVQNATNPYYVFDPPPNGQTD